MVRRPRLLKSYLVSTTKRGVNICYPTTMLRIPYSPLDDVVVLISLNHNISPRLPSPSQTAKSYITNTNKQSENQRSFSRKRCLSLRPSPSKSQMGRLLRFPRLGTVLGLLVCHFSAMNTLTVRFWYDNRRLMMCTQERKDGARLLF